MNRKSNLTPLLIFVLVVLLGSNSIIAQNVGIGSEIFSPDPSAGFEIRSTNKGLLLPRMTTSERNAISSPAHMLIIANITTNCIEIFAGGVWQEIFCAECPIPNAPTAATHLPSETQIQWNWNTSTGATGYKWHTSDNYADATDLGNSTSYSQTGLTCNTPYTLFVWAYNTCGNSTALTLTQTTSACPFVCGSSTVTFTYNVQQVTYGTVQRAYGGSVGTKCWLDRNLGATQVASSSTDANSYGDIFQWGRAADGHQIRNPLSGTTSTLSGTNQPPHSNFIMINISPNDWRSPQNANLWQGVNGINNPCPNGWRVPTETEWNAERLSWAPNNNATGAINSPLKLPLTGYRKRSDGLTDLIGSNGLYWSSTVSGNDARHLWIRPDAIMSSITRAVGASVRCIKD